MALSSHRRPPLLAAMFLGFLIGAATCGRTTTTSSPSPSPSTLSRSQELAEEKSRLGSTPPSCRNRCNACSPVPAATIPGFPRSAGSGDDEVAGFSNYKPVGWKCCCAGRLYDP